MVNHLKKLLHSATKTVKKVLGLKKRRKTKRRRSSAATTDGGTRRRSRR